MRQREPERFLVSPDAEPPAGFAAAGSVRASTDMNEGRTDATQRRWHFRQPPVPCRSLWGLPLFFILELGYRDSGGGFRRCERRSFNPCSVHKANGGQRFYADVNQRGGAAAYAGQGNMPPRQFLLALRQALRNLRPQMSKQPPQNPLIRRTARIHLCSVHRPLACGVSTHPNLHPLGLRSRAN